MLKTRPYNQNIFSVHLIWIVLCFLIYSAPVFSQTIITRWDFEDLDVIVDENTPENFLKYIEREKTPGINVSFPAGNPGYCFSSDTWESGMNSKYYVIEFSTLYTQNHILYFDQYSTANGPGNFNLEYRIGTTGLWTNFGSLMLPASAWYKGLVTLPSVCDNKQSVFVRWIMSSNSSASGGIVTPSGTNSLDNIFITGTVDYSCFTYGYMTYHTCGSVYSFPSSASGGLGSPPEGTPGAPDYGTCWKNVNAGNRANWIVIQPTSSGLWTFNFSPSTGNINAWIWGPFATLPNACSDLQNLLDCNNGTGGSPISISAIVEAGKFYVTLVTNPTGTNSIITITTTSGEATLIPPVTYNSALCGAGTLTLRASGATLQEKYEWWDSPVGGTLLKRSVDNLDSTFTTPFLTSTTIYYVNKLFLLPAPYPDSCSSIRVPATAIILPVPIAPISVSTNLTNVCFPDTRNIILTANGGSGATLNWYVSSCQSSLVGTGNPLTVTAPLVTSTYYAAWETVCGISACAWITITVNDIVTEGSVSGNQTICSWNDPVIIQSDANGTGSGLITYRWENYQGSGPWINVPGAIGSSYDPPAGLAQTTSFRRITVSTESGGICESIPTNIVTVFVNNVTPGVVGIDQVLCLGDDPKTITESVAATGNVTITYQWEQSMFPVGPWITVSGAVNNIYTPPAGLPQTTYFRRIANSELNLVICSLTSNTVSIIVNSLPSTSLIFHQ